MSTLSLIITQLECSALDKLWKLGNDNPHLAYMYREKVVVPPLQMIDSVLTGSKCGSTARAMNSLVIRFMLKFAKIHVGRKSYMCPQLFVQNKELRHSEQEKYLGDIIHKMGSNMPQLWTEN